MLCQHFHKLKLVKIVNIKIFILTIPAILWYHANGTEINKTDWGEFGEINRYCQKSGRAW